MNHGLNWTGMVVVGFVRGRGWGRGDLVQRERKRETPCFCTACIRNISFFYPASYAVCMYRCGWGGRRK